MAEPEQAQSRKLARRYHVHPPGLVYAGVTTIIGIGAINSQNNLLFVVFGVALSALLFSGLFSGAMLMGVTVERRPEATASPGRPLRITYVVHNRNRFIPAFGLSITELRPRRRATSKWTTHLTPPSAFVAQVGGRDSVRTSAGARAIRRGEARLDVITLSSSFPFGVFRKSVRFSQPERVIVLPETRPLSAGIFQAISTRSQRGDAVGAKRGRGEEFYGLRDYSSGDSPRFIAWKASARSGNLVTRLTSDTASTVLRILFLLDEDATDDENETAITLVASLIDAAHPRQIHVGLCVPQADISIEPGASNHHRLNLLKALALVDLRSLAPSPAGVTPFGGAGANLVVAPRGRTSDLAPPRAFVLANDALARWALEAPRPGAPREGAA